MLIEKVFLINRERIIYNGGKYMLKYAELFIEHLQKINPVNVDFKVELGVDDDGNEVGARIIIPYSGSHITASFFGDKDGTQFSASMAIGMIAPNCVGLVTRDVLALCNELNNKNQWVRFCVRDGKSIPGLNGALICLEEATVLVEKTAAQDAYSVVSNLIKAHKESAEAFKKILNGSPVEKEKANNRYVNMSEKQKEILKNITNEKPKESLKGIDKKQNNNLKMWFPVIFIGVSILLGVVLCYITDLLIYALLGCVLSGCGLGIMLKQKEKRQTELLKQDQIVWQLVLKQKKKENLPTVLTWILFVLGMIIFWILSL